MYFHEIGGIRNENRIMNDLSTYIRKVMHNKEYVYYLNQSGHKLFSEGKVVHHIRISHDIVCNETWLYLFYLDDLQVETEIKYIKNNKKKKIIPDVKFRDDNILHAVEIDRTQIMLVNDKKLKCYENF